MYNINGMIRLVWTAALNCCCCVVGLGEKAMWETGYSFVVECSLMISSEGWTESCFNYWRRYPAVELPWNFPGGSLMTFFSSWGLLNAVLSLYCLQHVLFCYPAVVFLDVLTACNMHGIWSCGSQNCSSQPTIGANLGHSGMGPWHALPSSQQWQQQLPLWLHALQLPLGK